MSSLVRTVLEADIAAVRLLAKNNQAKFDELKTAIKSAKPDELFTKAPKRGYFCTCGNGEGEDGTGIEADLANDGQTYLYNCFKCPRHGDLIDLIAFDNHLDRDSNFFEVLAIGANIIGFPLNDSTPAQNIQSARSVQEVQDTAKSTATDDKKLAIIHDDIEIAQKNLPDFIENQGGKYRGLTYETYNHFGCGYKQDWIHPKAILAYKQGKLPPPIPSPRLIVPTVNHYNAIVLKENRKPGKNKCMHAGSKKEEVFGVDLLPVNAELIIIAEGEINAMSIWQATGYDVIATGGAADFKSTVQLLQAKFTAIDKKPKIAIAFDSDEAGRKNAPRLRESLLNIGFPAVCIFLSDEESDIDANDILVNEGDAALAEKIHNLIDSAQNDFADEIEKLYTQCLIDNETSDVVKSRCNLKPTDLTDSDTSILSVRADKVNERTDFLMGTDTTVTNATKMDLFTLKEAAAYLGVNEKTLRRWNKQKIFAPYLIDHHGDFFYTREEIEQLKEVYTKRRNKTYSNVRDMSAQCPQSDSRKLEPEEKFALFSLPHSDLYNAQRLSMFHGKHIRFLTDSYHWFIYHDNKWNDSGKENSAVLPFAFDLAATIAANVDKTNDADTKLYKQWQKSSTVSNAIAMLKGVKPIRITRQDLNTHPHLLNCKNGVVDLRDGKLYPHDSKYLLTQCVNAVYRAGYTNDRVDKFLQEILPDDKTRQAVLRYLGYALTGDVSEEKALFIHGTGGNGKGTLTKTLLTLLDDYGCAFPIEAVLVQPRITKTADACTPAFNKLLFNRLAIADEIPAQRKMDYAVFKLLTGGDPVPIRKLYEEGAEIKNPTHKFIFSGNHLPELADTHDPGILRRLIVVRFDQDFTQKPDTKLKQFLQSDDALSALLNLLVAEAVAWYRDGGLIVSDKMRHDRDSYLTENDFISEFIETYCIRGNDRSVSLKDFIKRLRDAYPAETFENYGKGDKALTKVIEKIPGIVKRRITAGNMLFGIGWRDTDTVSADSTANSSGVDFGGKDVDDDDVPF